MAERRPYYTPERVRWLVDHWQELQAAAESPAHARHLLEPFHPGPTPTMPRSVRQRGYRGGSMHWAAVVADIESAWITLAHSSLEANVVWARMQGHSLTRFSQVYRLRKATVLEGYQHACERMAGYLEGGAAAGGTEG